MALAATLAGPALAGPAFACSSVVGFSTSDCDDPPPRPPDSGKVSPATSEARLIHLINESRAHQGLRPLRFDRRATEVARQQAKRMVERGSVHHNPKMRTRAGRRSLGLPANSGENVGVGPDAAAIHQAFLDSRGHRAAILSPGFRGMGIGVVNGMGQIWVTEVFVGSGSRQTAAAAAATSVRRPKAQVNTGVAPLEGITLSAPNPATDTSVVMGITPVTETEEFPWLALLPSLAVALWLAGRRRTSKRVWV